MFQPPGVHSVYLYFLWWGVCRNMVGKWRGGGGGENKAKNELREEGLAGNKNWEEEFGVGGE